MPVKRRMPGASGGCVSMDQPAPERTFARMAAGRKQRRGQGHHSLETHPSTSESTRNQAFPVRDKSPPDGQSMCRRDRSMYGCHRVGRQRNA